MSRRAPWEVLLQAEMTRQHPDVILLYAKYPDDPKQKYDALVATREHDDTSTRLGFLAIARQQARAARTTFEQLGQDQPALRDQLHQRMDRSDAIVTLLEQEILDRLFGDFPFKP